jgi:hypothetical protein
MVELRNYQHEALIALFEYWRSGGGNALIDLPTGTGKSLVIADLARRLVLRGRRIVIVSHVREIVTQDAAAIRAIWPGMPSGTLGINSAALGERDTAAPLLLATVQSICRSPQALGPRLFDRVVYTYSIAAAVKDGWLAPLVAKDTDAKIDTSSVGSRGGEFILSELEQAADQHGLVEAAVAEIVTHGAGRRHGWLAFCCGVEHSFHVRDALQAHGVSAATIVGTTPNEERKHIIAEFRAGRITCLTGGDVFTPGFDVAHVDLIAMLRPTLSPGLYMQTAGRGTRLSPGKKNCIAEGELVLTDYGLVAIEAVTTAMRVWDGDEFVEHCGVVCRGEQEVISYAGLTATPDHQVWTKEGWTLFRQCAVEQIAIAVTGNGRQTIRAIEGHFCNGRSEQRPRVHDDRVLDVQHSFVQGLQQPGAALSWLSFMRSAATCAKMAVQSMQQRKRPLHQSEQQMLRRLRWPLDRISIYVATSNGAVGSRTPWPASRIGDRSDRIRRALRIWQSAVYDWFTKRITHATSTTQCVTASLPTEASEYSLCGLNLKNLIRTQSDFRTDH